MTELRTLRTAYSIQSTSSMHHYEYAALYEDISLQRGRFCTRSLASCIPRSSEDRSSRMFFIQVVRGCPGGRLQFSGGGSGSATYQDKKNFTTCLGPPVLWGPWTLPTLVHRSWHNWWERIGRVLVTIICIQSRCLKSSSIWRRIRSTSSSAVLEPFRPSPTDGALDTAAAAGARSRAVVARKSGCPAVGLGVRHVLRRPLTAAPRRRPTDFKIDFGSSVLYQTKPFIRYTAACNTCSIHTITIRYDTRCYFNVRSKADMSQLNLPHGTDN